MYLAFDVAIVADREERVRRSHLRLTVKFSARGAQQLVAVDALDGRRPRPRVFHAAALILFVPDTDRAADLAPAAA